MYTKFAKSCLEWKAWTYWFAGDFTKSTMDWRDLEDRYSQHEWRYFCAIYAMHRKSRYSGCKPKKQLGASRPFGCPNIQGTFEIHPVWWVFHLKSRIWRLGSDKGTQKKHTSLVQRTIGENLWSSMRFFLINNHLRIVSSASCECLLQASSIGDYEGPRYQEIWSIVTPVRPEDISLNSRSPVWDPVAQRFLAQAIGKKNI